MISAIIKMKQIYLVQSAQKIKIMREGYKIEKIVKKNTLVWPYGMSATPRPWP